MNYLSHIAIAKIIFDQFSQDLKSNLEKQSFIFGNIKPDLASGGSPVPGSRSEAINQINDKAECILSKIQTIEEYSIQLGEICHMVCDAFSDRHPEGGGKLTSIHHVINQLKNHRTISRFENYNVYAGNVEIASLKDIKEVFLKLLDAHEKEVKGSSNDIEYSIAASVWVCDSISILLSKSSRTHLKTPVEDLTENKIA